MLKEGAAAKMVLRTRPFSLSMPRASRVERDFDCLLERMRQRLYPESMQVLTSYWLRTIRAEDYQQTEWSALDRALQQTIAGDRTLTARAVHTIASLRDWIQTIRHIHHQPSPRSSFGPARQVSSDSLVPYLFRLLNEWLPVEVAHLLVEDDERFNEPGIPVAVVARAIERLLAREHLSPATLESMLLPGILSPRLVYPADTEILQDVILFLLGRTNAPAPAKLPAALMCVAPDAPLSLAYADAVTGAVLTAGSSGAAELRVSIPRSQAIELLKTDHVRITSAVVTMDGQLWQADKLQRGERDFIVYRPAGRLRIDYSADHALMVLPWPETREHWTGSVSFSGRLEMFGREWRISHWEQIAEGALLHLEFVAPLPLAALAPGAETRLFRSHPAEIDMAWTALERALAASFDRRSLEPMEQLHRAELAPLGRALFGLAESVITRRSRSTDVMDTRLEGIRYLSAALFPIYGPIPWRILPAAVRKTLIANRMYHPFAHRFHEVFEGLPEGWGESGAAPCAAEPVRQPLPPLFFTLSSPRNRSAPGSAQ